MMYLCSGERDGARCAQKSNKSITKSIKMTFDSESKCGVDAFLTLKVNTQKYGVNFFRKYVQIREMCVR